MGLASLCLIALTSVSIGYAQTGIKGLGRLQHDEDQGIHNALYKISDSRAILAYSGFKSLGYVRTFSIANDGTIAQLGELRFDDDDAEDIAIEQVASDVYVIAYKGRSNDGFITTVKVSADGKTITQLKKVEHDKKQGLYNRLIKVDSDTYALYYYGDAAGNGATMKTFTIPADGSTITEEKSVYITGKITTQPTLIKADSDTYISVHSYDGTNGIVRTWDISADGKTITNVKSQTISQFGQYPSIVKLDSDSYAVASYGQATDYTGYNRQGGIITTLDIPVDGSTITEVAKMLHSYQSVGRYNSFGDFGNNIYVIAYQGQSNRGKLRTVRINPDGKLIHLVQKGDFYNSTTTYNSMVKLGTNIALIAHSDGSKLGYLQTYKIENDHPYFNAVTLALDNSALKVTFNEAVFNTNGGSGALEASDFKMGISGGQATLKSATPSSIAISGNTYTLGIPLNTAKKPMGTEVITVEPLANSIYDTDGNVVVVPASVASEYYIDRSGNINNWRNRKTLNDQLLPFIQSSDTDIAVANTPFAVTFNEPVYSKNDGSGNLEKEDFVLSIAGGTGTLKSATPTGISRSGNKYTLAISYDKLGNGKEVLSVAPASNAIYDKAGNIASTTQSNNSITLNDGRLTVGRNHPLYSNTSTYFQTVKLNRAGANSGKEYLVYYQRYNKPYQTLLHIPTDGNSVTTKINENADGGTSGRGHHAVIKGPGNLYITARQGYNYRTSVRDHLIVETIAIHNDRIRKIYGIKVSDYPSSSYNRYPSLVQINDSTTVIAFEGKDYDGMIATLKIKSDGVIELLNKLEHDTSQGRFNSLVKVDDNTVALAYEGYNKGSLNTFDIAADGAITEIASHTYATGSGAGSHNHLIRLNAQTFVLAYKGASSDGYINTYAISDDGKTITKKKELEHDTNQNAYNSLLRTGPNSVMLAYSGVNDDGFIKSFDITTDGTTITQNINLEHDKGRGQYNNLFPIDSDTYGLSYYNTSGHGYTKIFNSALGASDVAPEISSVSMAATNTSLQVTFNEPVFTNSAANTALVKEDFKLSITGGTAKLSSETPSSIAISGNTYKLGVLVSGTANGNEKLTVVPAGGSAIYDADGNTANQNQDHNNSIYLADKTPAKIVKSKLLFNEHIDIYFDEVVFGANNGQSNLNTNDFVYSITGGTATLASNKPSSVEGYARYDGTQEEGGYFKLGIKLSGVPNGEEKLTVAVADNAVYDLWGNISVKTEAKTTVTLAKSKMLSKGIFEFDYDYGRMSSVAQLSDGKYVVAYEGPDHHGYIMTYSVADDGTIKEIRKFEHDIGWGQWNSLLKADEDTYILAYGTNGNDGMIKTFDIPADGSSITEIASKEHDGSNGTYNSLVRVDHDTYLLAYTGYRSDGFLKTFDIPKDGKTITQVKSYEFDDQNGLYMSLVELQPNYFAVAYSHSYRDHRRRTATGSWGSSIHTYKVPDDGTAITGIASLQHNTRTHDNRYEAFIKLDEDSYALAYRGYGDVRDAHKGVLKTFTIPKDGSSVKLESVQSIFDDNTNSEDGMFNAVLKMNSENLLVKSRDKYADWWLKTYKISNTGKTLTEDWKIRIATDSDWNRERSLFQVSGDVFGAAYPGASSDGYIQLVTMESDDSKKPVIVNGKMSFDNMQFLIGIDEPVFKANTGKGMLEKTDFDLTLTGGTATLSSNNPSSLTRLKDKYLLTVGYNGIADGNEKITIAPAKDAIFDGKGNAMDVAQSNNTSFTLNEKTPPAITATTLSSDNITATVTMSEKVYANVNGSANLTKDDFALSLSGGTATLARSTPKTISWSGNIYTLTIEYSGVANGTETLTITPAQKSIYDDAGNEASTTQSNNKLSLNEVRILTEKTSVHNSSQGNWNSMQQRDADTYVLAYTGSGSDGYIQTFDINANGSTINKKRGWRHDNRQGNYNSLVKVADDIFALAYTGYSNDGYIRTFKIDASGNIAAKNSIEHNKNFGTYNALTHLTGTTYVLAYTGVSNKGKMSTFTIPANGASITNVKTINMDASRSQWNAIHKMTDSTVVVVYEGSGPKFLMKTFQISSDGKTITEKKSETIFEGKANWNAITQVDANTYVIATQGKDDDGYLYTYDVAPDGSSIAKVTELEFDDEKSLHHTLYNAGSNSFVLAHTGTSNSRTYGKMFTIPADGSKIKQIYNTKLNDYGSGQSALSRIDADTYAFAFSGNGLDGIMSSLTIRAGDTVLPVISFIAINDDNSSVQVTFNEDVYNSAGASGSLEVSDFSLTITGGTAKLPSATPTKISANGKVYTLGFDLTGTADGQEVFKVSPVDKAIFDGGGNTAATNQTNGTANLKDKAGPAISKTVLANDNSTATITLNEKSYSTGSGSGALEKSDFVLSIDGGLAKLAGTTPTSISVSGNDYTLGFGLTGSPDGNEVLKINPASKSIFDASGNTSTTLQTNNTANLKDIVPAVIDSIELAGDNSIVQVFFNEPVFSKDDGSGALDSADFVYSLTGGNATLAKKYPSSVSGSGTKTLSLGVLLTGKPSGKEVLTVTPVSKSVFDKPGNITSTTQSKNKANLNDKFVPQYSASALAPDNSVIAVTFNEPVFAKSNATGKIDTSDFEFTLNGGSAKLLKAYPDSVGQVGNTYSLGIKLDGLADGSETFTFKPKSGAIFDSTGNKASTTQSFSSLKLNDKAPPEIKSLSLAADNSKLSIDFTESVYSKGNGTGDLEKSDFVFSVTGETIVLTSPFPTSISKSGNTFTLGIGSRGDPNGTEVLSVLIVDNAVFDGSGNPAKMEQDKNKVTFNDKNAPLITKLDLATDNSTLTVTMNEPTFSASDGTGSLDSTAFILKINNGASTLSQQHPKTLKTIDSTFTYILGLPLTGIADGSEELIISFADDGLYDASGTEAAQTQVINKVTLFDLSAPVISESKLDSDNKKVMVRFSVPVFSSAKAAGTLERDDFRLSLVGGSATLKNTTPSSIDSSDNGRRYKLGIEIAGIPDGRETLTINPVDNNVFDASANPANKIQSNNSMNLFDKQPPVIKSVTLSSTNDSLFVTFDESVYAKEDGTDSLKADDFLLSLSGGIAGLKNSNPATASGSGKNYILTFGLSGTPDGNEKIIVNANNRSIFDAAGNPGVNQDRDNSVFLNDKSAPRSPQGLAGIPGNNQATLSWKTTGETDISKYYIYGGTSTNPTQKIDSTQSGGNVKVISGLTNEVTYYFKVSGLDKTGYEGALSDTVSVKPTTTQSFTVKADGSGDFSNAQAAIDAAVSGDSVYIEAGSYDSLRVDGKSIQIIAGDGPTKSFIDAKGKTTAVKLSGYPNQTTISGFTIMNGVGDNNENGQGGGIVVEPGVNATIDNCVLTNNEDGAIYFGDSSEVKISNTLAYGNDKSFVFGSGTANFINCTFVQEKENSVMGSGAKINFINTIFMNEIVASDTVTDISLWANYSLFLFGENTFNPNLIKEYNWGKGNIEGDPMFVDTLNLDYHLQKESPAIGVGIQSINVAGLTYEAPEKDLDGYNRPSPSGSAPDMGIYESPYSSAAPSANQISDGLSDSVEVDYSSSNSSLSAHWKRFGGSNVVYEYAIGTATDKRTDVKNWTVVGFDTTITATGLSLVNSTTYYMSIRGKNNLGETSTVTSDGVTIDYESPKINSVTELKEDVDWFGPNMPGHIFVDATDNTGIVKYEFSIGTTKGGDDVITWTESDSNSIAFDVKDLAENVTYYSNAIVTDYVGYSTSASSDSFMMDFTSPEQGYLSIGNAYQSDTANVQFSWTGFIDEQSGIKAYHYGLGTEPGLDDVIPRTTLNLNANFPSLSFMLTGLKLQVNQTYYGFVVAEDNVNNEVTAISDGLTIDRDGPDDGIIIDGLASEDIDHYNDTTSASASWDGFYDFNGIDKYELSLNTTTSAGSEVVVVNWTDVGQNLSHTFTDLSLTPNRTYYFSIKGYDKLGNSSNIVVSDGFIVDMNNPSISAASISPEQPQSVMLPLSIDFTISEVAQSVDIEFGSARGDLVNLEPKFNLDSTNLNVSFTPPFTSGDQISLDIYVTDLAGNTSETISYTYTIGFLGDYDFDNEIGLGDLNAFVNGWRVFNDLTKELGPVTGTAPYFRPVPDGVFDLRDGMAFVRMWRWYQSNSTGKILAKQQASIGKAIDIESSPDHFTIVPPRGTRAVEVILDYPVNDIDLSLVTAEALTDQAITLTWVDTTHGSILLHSAQLKGNSAPIRINVGHLQKELDIPVDISYQFLGKDQDRLGSGNTVLEIMPVPTEFALHNNYPNPFNPVTTINYDLPQEGTVRLIIYDVMGREVTRLVNGFTPAGYHSVRWNAKNQMGESVSAGVYFYHLQSGNFIKTQKMVLLK